MKGAAVGGGDFQEPTQIMAFVRCQCPGRATPTNVFLAMKQSEVKPDVIHLANCMAKAKPECPYVNAEEMGKLVEEKTGVPVVHGTHDYV